MTETLRTITVTLTKEQLEQLNAAWKKHPHIFNRSDFVREAINAYAGKQIFQIKKPRYLRELEEAEE